jgi:hypothetical protein
MKPSSSSMNRDAARGGAAPAGPSVPPPLATGGVSLRSRVTRRFGAVTRLLALPLPLLHHKIFCYFSVGDVVRFCAINKAQAALGRNGTHLIWEMVFSAEFPFHVYVRERAAHRQFSYRVRTLRASLPVCFACLPASPLLPSILARANSPAACVCTCRCVCSMRTSRL